MKGPREILAKKLAELKFIFLIPPPLNPWANFDQTWHKACGMISMIIEKNVDDF